MSDVEEYFEALPAELKPLASKIKSIIEAALPHCKTKVWHSIPVWFDEGNPIATYFEKKGKISVMFWNGQKFDEKGLKSVGKYSAADITYENEDTLNEKQLKAWLKEAKAKPQTDLAMRVKV
ncbi:MAG: DUF1801 domain-containing protein [Micrococcales bacterium]